MSKANVAALLDDTDAERPEVHNFATLAAVLSGHPPLPPSLAQRLAPHMWHLRTQGVWRAA